MAKEKQIQEEELEQDYDVLLDDESWGNSTVTIIATIILTMATISGIGYWFHLRVIDGQTASLEKQILQVETRLITEIKTDNSGSSQIADLEKKVSSKVNELEGVQEELINKEAELTIAKEMLSEKEEELIVAKADLETAKTDLAQQSTLVESQKLIYEGTIVELNSKVVELESQVDVINSRIEITQ